MRKNKFFSMLLSAKEIINKSLELFKRDLHTWIPYMLVNFGAAIFGLLLVFNPTVVLFFATLGVSSTVVMFINVLIALVLTIFDIWFHVALIRTIHTRLFNQPVGGIQIQFQKTHHLIGRALGISLLVGTIVFLPMGLSLVGFAVTGFEELVLGNLKDGGMLYVFFGLLGLYGIFHFIYFSIKYAFSYYVVAVDEKNIRESLHEGNALTHGRMGEVLWRLAVPVTSFFLIYIFANYIFTAIAKLVGQNFVVVIANILSLAVSAAVALLCLIATVILYEDAKAKPVVVKKPLKEV